MNGKDLKGLQSLYYFSFELPINLHVSVFSIQNATISDRKLDNRVQQANRYSVNLHIETACLTFVSLEDVFGIFT